ADLEAAASEVQSREHRALGAAIGMHAHPGSAGERLDREVGERKAIADLAEDLPRAAVVVRKRAVEETGANNGAIRADRVEREVRAAAKIARAEAPAAIGRDMTGVDIGAAEAIQVVLRSGVARRKADAAIAADARVDAGEEAREIALHARRVAIAVEL